MYWFFLIIACVIIPFISVIISEKKKEEEARAKQRANQNSNLTHCSKSFIETYKNQQQATQPADPLDTFVRYSVSAPSIRDGCPMLYRYPNLSVKNVNRAILSSIVKAKDFDLLPVKSETGSILLKWHGTTVAQLTEKEEMCSDWLTKQLPLKCEFAAFGKGREKVALFFYKDQESTLKDHKCEIVKLTSCMSAAKQETIAFLEYGEKLFVEWDDNDKPYLRDISYNPVGNLPARFAKLCENDLIDGIFFDHTEIKKSEDFEKEDKLIPFVRVYTSEE